MFLSSWKLSSTKHGSSNPKNGPHLPAAAYVSPRQWIMALFLGTPGVEQSALFKSDDEQEREMTASEAEGCFYWPAVGSSEMFPGRYRRRRRLEKNTPTKILTDSGRGRSKKRRKGGEREGENVQRRGEGGCRWGFPFKKMKHRPVSQMADCEYFIVRS